MAAPENAVDQYGVVAKAFHWLIFLLIAAQMVIALVMPHIGRNTKPEGLVDLHLSVGALIIVVVLARLAWRVTHPVAAFSQDVAPWMQFSAKAVHVLLYIVLIVMPVLGWANASTRGFPVTLFGAVPLPKLLPTHMKNGGLIGDVHTFLAYYVMLPLIGLHIVAALYHHFGLRDGVLRRMLPMRA